jgi:hypothetical protein
MPNGANYVPLISVMAVQTFLCQLARQHSTKPLGAVVPSIDRSSPAPPPGAAPDRCIGVGVGLWCSLSVCSLLGWFPIPLPQGLWGLSVCRQLDLVAPGGRQTNTHVELVSWLGCAAPGSDRQIHGDTWSRMFAAPPPQHQRIQSLNERHRRQDRKEKESGLRRTPEVDLDR